MPASRGRPPLQGRLPAKSSAFVATGPDWRVDRRKAGAHTVAPPPPLAAFDLMASDSTSPSTRHPTPRHPSPRQQGERRPDRGRAGRGVRRHRHQPALRAARDVPARHQPGADARACAGRAVDAVLGGDAHRHHQIRHPDHARRQQGRRRRAGAGDARHPRPERQGPQASARAITAARRDRPGAVLRRRHHHAGHLGDERRRGPVGRGAGPRALSSCRWRWSSWSALFLLQARGTADVGRLFGPGHAGLVPRAGRAGRLADRQEPGGAAGDQSALCAST